jgi:hypothetical protein
MSQPANQSVLVGHPATFSVQATGTAPLGYQWRQNSADILGATAPSYTTPATTTSDNGAQFTVVVTNSAGSVTSSAATLFVSPNQPGQLSTSASSLNFGYVQVGSSSTLGVTFTNIGVSNVTFSNISASGVGYTFSGIAAGFIIPPGASATFNVTFAPAGPGSSLGLVSAESDALNSSVTITLSALAAFHWVTLVWAPSTSTQTSYQILRATEPGGPYGAVNSETVTGTQFTDVGVQAGQTYFYVVNAISSGVAEEGGPWFQASPYSNEISATIPTP